MPIHNMKYEGGVFTAKQVGYIDNVDVKMWSNALKKHAKNNDLPLIALIDMREVERLVPTVTKVFAGALASPNVVGVAIIASDTMGSRNAAILSKLDQLNGVRIFSTMEQAAAYARSQINPNVGVFATASAVTFAVAVAAF